MAGVMGDLLRQTLADPRDAAQTVMRWPMGIPMLWQVAALLVILSVVFSQISGLILPLQAAGPFGLIMAHPLLNAGVQAFIFVVSVHACHKIGRALGGTGRFDEALKLMVWLQAINVGIQAVQIMLLILMPPVAGLTGFASLVLFFWLLTNFVTVLHGFTSRWHVFMGIILSFFAIFVGLSLLLGLLTMLIPGGTELV